MVAGGSQICRGVSNTVDRDRTKAWPVIARDKEWAVRRPAWQSDSLHLYLEAGVMLRLPGKLRTTILICVALLVSWSGRADAPLVTPAELYIKVAADVAWQPRSCQEISQWLEEAFKPWRTVECTAMRGNAGTYRLRWRQLIDSRELVSWLSQQRNAGYLEWYEAKGGGLTLQSANALSGSQDFIDYLKSLLIDSHEPIDPGFIDDTALRLRNLIRIHAPAAPVVVAIIDSGINFDGMRLAGLNWENPKEIAGNSIDDDGNGYIDDKLGWDFVDEGVASLADDTLIPDNDPSDLLGHGTAVASIVAATFGENLSPYVKLMALRVASGVRGSGSVSPFALAEAIHYAANNGAHVVNLSVGSVSAYEVVREAIIAAQAKGVIVIAAAGNTGGAILFPANMPSVTAIGALDNSGAIWGGSARNEGIAFYIRGTNMLAELGLATNRLSSDGTSFAAPGATARAAMLRVIAGEGDACQATLELISKHRPSSQLAVDWVGAIVNRLELDLGDGAARLELWTRRQMLCGAQGGVASILRRAN